MLTALPTHQDERVGFPVGRGDLVGEPGSDCFSGFDAELGHRLGNVFDPVQQPLGSVVVVFQETVRLQYRWRGLQMSRKAGTLSVV